MEKNKIKFYDTSALLAENESLFEKKETFVISSVTLEELERIKTSSNKDSDIKYAARLLLRLMNENPNLWTSVIHTIDNENILRFCGFEMNNDLKILSDVITVKNKNPETEVEFITNDLNLKAIARSYFNGPVTSTKKEVDTYCGFKEIIPDEDALAKFYQTPQENIFNLLTNEYLIIKNKENEIVDVRVWTGNEYRYLSYPSFNSRWFGKVRPYDIYQKIYFDSLNNNKITMVRGKPGSGKTYLSMAYLINQLLVEGKIDKIIIFCNTVATIDSAKLGFYPGSKDEKLLDSQIGNLLMSKLGGREGLEELMDREQLVLLPFSDIRGFDTSGMNAGIYITEAQNLSRTLMKLALQRIGEDCICIIDGDNNQQVDAKAFDGANNGMRALSKVFRGEDIYGEVKFQNIYRSKIASIAEKIKTI